MARFEPRCSLPSCDETYEGVTAPGWGINPAILLVRCPAHTESGHDPVCRWGNSELRILCSCGTRIGEFKQIPEGLDAYVTHLELMNDAE